MFTGTEGVDGHRDKTLWLGGWFQYGPGKNVLSPSATGGKDAPWRVRRVTSRYLLIVPNSPYNYERNARGVRRYVLLRWEDIQHP